jgi:hypothetical protein
MNTAKLALAVFAAAASSVASAQVVKCTDNAANITYTNIPCERQGLREAGPVRERLTWSMPSREMFVTAPVTGAVALAPRPATTVVPGTTYVPVESSEVIVTRPVIR